MQDLLGLAGFAAVCLGAAWFGRRVSTPELASWYAALRQPVWTPPNWAHGPVWTLLYLTVAVAGWMVWRRVGWDGGGEPLLLLGAAIALHLLWWTVFFHFRDPGAALVLAGLLVVVTAGATLSFFRLQPMAGLLFLPYALWIGVMAVTNYLLWRLNTP